VQPGRSRPTAPARTTTQRIVRGLRHSARWFAELGLALATTVTACDQCRAHLIHYQLRIWAVWPTILARALARTICAAAHFTIPVRAHDSAVFRLRATERRLPRLPLADIPKTVAGAAPAGAAHIAMAGMFAVIAGLPTGVIRDRPPAFRRRPAAGLTAAISLGLAGFGKDRSALVEEGGTEDQSEHTPARSGGCKRAAQRVESFMVHGGATLLTVVVLETGSRLAGKPVG
jgi:hypothetical protein